MKKIVLLAAGILALGWSCVAQPANLSPGLQEIVKLTQAHMSDDVIVAYIRNSGAAYTLSADDILYLNSQGVSQPVLSELLHSKANAAPTTPPVATTPPPAAAQAQVPPPVISAGGPVAQPTTPPPDVGAPSTPPPDSEVNMAYFQSRLTPDGAWVDVPGYGPCWRPAVAVQNPDWRPYFDSGHWVYTDDGWTWQSDYAWGEIAFHYGRWFRDPASGWVWLPGYNWGPAWVAWRHAEGVGFCGWAPLPPAAHFEVGVGLSFHGAFGADLDFGLAPAAFVFVPFDHFWVSDYHGWIAPRERVDVIFHASVVVNGYGFVGGRFVVDGIGRDRMALLTHHPVVVERVTIRDDRIARAREYQHVRSEEARHVISHDTAMHQQREIHQDVRHVEQVRHEEAVRRVEPSRQPARGGAPGREERGRDDRRDEHGNNPK